MMKRGTLRRNSSDVASENVKRSHQNRTRVIERSIPPLSALTSFAAIWIPSLLKITEEPFLMCTGWIFQVRGPPLHSAQLRKCPR